MSREAGFDPAPEVSKGLRKQARVFPSRAGRLIDDDEEEKEDAAALDEPVDETAFVQMTVVKGNPASQFKAPASFFDRDCYKELSDLNLVALPDMEGCGLWCHASSSQWHAYRGAAKKGNFAPSWGATRSETLAFLLAVQKLWQWYLEDHPADPTGQKILSAIEAKIAKTPF